MALVLTVAKGGCLYVGETRVEVTKVYGPTSYQVEVGGQFLLDINAKDWTQLFEGCDIRAPFASPRTAGGHHAALQIRAPGINVSRNRPQAYQQGEKAWN